VYATCAIGDELKQGEILSNVIQYVYDPQSEEVAGELHDYAIIASQECDLLRAHEAITSGQPSPLNEVLLFPASPADIGRKAANLN
jgi:hypothetical protein